MHSIYLDAKSQGRVASYPSRPYGLVVQERLAQDNQANEIGQSGLAIVEFSNNEVNARPVADFQFSAKRVRHQFFGEAAIELRLPCYQQFTEFRNSRERVSLRKFPSGIDFDFSFVVVSPASHGIEVFQGEAKRIDPKELETGQLIRSLEKLRVDYPHMPIVLEVHEGAVTSVQYLNKLVDRLKELQIELAYDDFGAGQARLLELFEVPPDILKFDLKFIRGLENATAQHRASVKSLIRVVQDLNVKALAEGVETANHAEICEELGFELAQGYYFDRPQPKDFWTTDEVLQAETQRVSSNPVSMTNPTELGDSRFLTAE